jgi:nucleotide-binding universal stress UspA family protein
VLGRVALLPLAEDVQLTILHVVPGSLSFEQQRRAERDARKALSEEVGHLRKQLHRKARIESVVKVGAAAKEIAAFAPKLDVDLIVMGRGGGRALRETFLGSTAERVVRGAKLPVLVVRSPARRAYRRPALALELDQAAHEVVHLMLRMLPVPFPRVEVIHAFDVPYSQLVYPSVSKHESDEREEYLKHEASRRLHRLLSATLSEAGIRLEDAPLWKTHVRHGSPREVVETATKKAEADLLVLGTRGHSGVAYVFLGTVAGELLRAARCDVLMVPPARRRRNRAS